MTALALVPLAPVTASASATPSICQTTGPISADELRTPVPVANCPIVGRLVIDHDGRNGVPIPGDGERSARSLVMPGGDAVLVVQNRNGAVTVTEDSGAPDTTPDDETGATASLGACDDNAYATHRGRWYDTLRWYLNLSSVDRSNLTRTAATDAIRAGNSNITLNSTDCGGAVTGAFRAYGDYQEEGTSAYANLNSSLQTTPKWPDGQSTVSFGPIDTGYLAWTQWHYHWSTWFGDYVADEADVYIASNVAWTVNPTTDCSNRYDLQSVMTHEWGHAFGLAHVSSSLHERLTMSPGTLPCTVFRRTLGLGDVLGMRHLYGTR